MRPVAVVGLGLMGGSLARDLARAGRPVLCWSPEPDEVRAAADLPGAMGADSLATALRHAEAVVLATPLEAVRRLLTGMPATVPDGCGWIQDLASLQAPPVRWAREAGLTGRFVSAHPLAGGERSGFAASREGLYRDAPVFLSGADVSPEVRTAVGDFWSGLGARPEWIDPEAHDRRMGWVSHLPQVVATHLARVLEDGGYAWKDLGPGGRDMVRLAGSSPVMWTDILAHAPGPVSAALRDLARRLEQEADALEGGEARRFGRSLDRTRSWRGT